MRTFHPDEPISFDAAVLAGKRAAARVVSLVPRSDALPSLEKARALLQRSRTIQEVTKIKAIAQAVASCAASEQARDEAAAIVLLAKARIGELTKEIERAPRGGKPGRGKSNCSKAEQLEAEGISRKEAAE